MSGLLKPKNEIANDVDKVNIHTYRRGFMGKICCLCDPSFPVRYRQNHVQEPSILDVVETKQPAKKRKPKAKQSGLQTTKSVLK